MEKPLLTLGPISWVGVPRDLQGKEQMLVRFVESQIWHLPASPVALWEEDSEKGQWPLPAFLSGTKLSPSSCFDARHFSSLLYVTGAFQAATPVLDLRGSESE